MVVTVGRRKLAAVTADDDAVGGRRLMLVHAHPDDESIGNGATMARYVDEGAEVTLVTCTLGEEGEVLVDDLGSPRRRASDELGSTGSAS